MKVYMYSGFDRFWHWAQGLLIIIMMISGFEIHGTYQLMGFESAVNTHIISAWVLMSLWVLVIFWHYATGEWKQYIPSSPNKLFAMLRYYGIDIFLGGGHPHNKTRQERLNPLQRLAYLSMHVLIAPVIWISGLLYLFYSSWDVIGIASWSLTPIALVHTGAAFAVIAFLIVHLYLAITTSKKPFAYVKAMITGYEDE